MPNSMITHHLTIKTAVQRIEAALERENAARAELERTGLSHIKDRIETAHIDRRDAYHQLKQAVDALIDGGM